MKIAYYQSKSFIGKAGIMLSLLFWSFPVHSAIEIEKTDGPFFKNVSRELDNLRSGKRGLVCKTLVERLDLAVATTTIKPLTGNDETWHPNDTRGTRTHVKAVDTLIRDAARTTPTDAILYLNPNHIDPKLSPFRLGTFVHYLALAMELNTGQFSGDFQERERGAMFFRNAWRDEMGFDLFEVSERIPTTEYQMAKDAGLITEDFSPFFPILDVDEFKKELETEPPSEIDPDLPENSNEEED